LDRAVVSLFRIAAGDTWIDNMDVLDKELGLVDWGIGAFVFSFILVVNWTFPSLRLALAEIFQRLLKSEGAINELTCENMIRGFAKLPVTLDESGKLALLVPKFLLY
jgi:hypothetical protein